MKLSEIKLELLKLSMEERQQLLSSFESLDQPSSYSCQQSRRESLNNKQGVCPHCNSAKYVKFGFKSNSQRYKCKSCRKSFTEYSGTWMAGIHSKEKIDDYLGLMLEEKSLDKIKVALSINKKTAFDWRHKILASLIDSDNDDFTGITESDETFFLNSEKGRSVTNRKSRKRGGSSKTRGISNDQVAVIVTQDRNSVLDLTVATMGRIKKVDIENAIGERIGVNKTILCSDGHISYKGFAIDNEIEHHPLKGSIKGSIKEYVKNGVYHIQHVNSTHNRVKKWIDNIFWGVSTKYLQQYLNWYRIKETIKNRKDKLKALTQRVTKDITAYQKYKNIDENYENLLSTLN